MVLPIDGRWQKCVTVAENFGFRVIKLPRTLPQRLHDALENVLIHALVWAFRPGKPRGRRASLDRVHWWIPRKDLVRRCEDLHQRSRLGASPLATFGEA
jgi:hypothetical protein